MLKLIRIQNVCQIKFEILLIKNLQKDYYYYYHFEVNLCIFSRDPETLHLASKEWQIEN